MLLQHQSQRIGKKVDEVMVTTHEPNLYHPLHKTPDIAWQSSLKSIFVTVVQPTTTNPPMKGNIASKKHPSSAVKKDMHAPKMSTIMLSSSPIHSYYEKVVVQSLHMYSIVVLLFLSPFH